MARLARSASLVIGVLALQVGVLGDGAVCAFAMQRMAPASEPMAAMDMATAGDRSTTPASDRNGNSERSTPAKSPCGQGGVPTACKTFASCAPVFVASATAVRSTPASPPSRALELAERAPASPVRAPEPPPPRASFPPQPIAT